MSSRESVLGPEDLPADVPQGQTEAVVKQQGIGRQIQSLFGGFGFGPRTTDPERLAQQKEMDTLARVKMGDAIVDRYGDVLQTRDRGFRDFLRDLATNEISGDLTKSGQVAEQVRSAFLTGVQRDIENDRAARQESLTRLDTWFQGVTKAQKIKVPGLQKQYLQALGERTGIPISKEVASLLASGGIPPEVFSDPQFQEMIQEDPVAAVSQLQAAGVDLIAAQGLVEELQGFVAKKAETAAKTGKTFRDIAEAQARRAETRKLHFETKRTRLRGIQEKQRLAAGLPIDAPKEKAGQSDPIKDAINDAINSAIGGESARLPRPAPKSLPSGNTFTAQ